MTQDFSGQNLRGRNFKGQDLTGANFSYADIRGANFTDSILIGANFSHAKAGLPSQWKFSLLAFSLIVAFLAGFAVAVGGAFVGSFLANKYEKFFTYPGIFYLIACIAFISLLIFKEVKSVFTLSMGIAFTFVLVLTFSFGLSVEVAGPVGFALVLILILAFIFALALALTFAEVVAEKFTFAVTLTLFGSAIGLLLVTFAPKFADVRAGAAIGMLFGTYSVTFISTYISWRAKAEDMRFLWLKNLAVEYAAIKGTYFQGSDLTHANFTKAILNNTDFSNANLTRAWFNKAQKLDRAKADNTILAKPLIRDLLVTGNGAGKSYIGANLKGANLIGAHLNSANLKGANISEANFQAANLEAANLTLTEAIGTDFTSAQMTGASVEAWNIESNTNLDNVDCRYIYLLESSKPGTDDRERRPSSGEFAPGEFTKLFQEVLTTVDLIFRNGVDWKAFIPAFQQVQVENEDTELTIQSIENKGDGVVVVRVSVPPDTNKEKIHREFTQNYEVALKAIEEKYQAKLESKDEQITVYRQQLEDSRQREIQQSSNMEKIIDILAKPALNIPVNESEVQAIAEGPTAVNLVILTLLSGDFETGFPFVIAQIWTEDERLPTQHSGQLPPAPYLVEFYHLWHSQYNRFIEPLQSSRMERKQGNLTNFSQVEIHKLAEELEEKLNKWLNAEQFIPIDRILREKFNRSDEVRIIIQSQSSEVRKLPWHLWDFLKPYRKAEIALSSPFYDRPLKTAVTRDRIRILSILGCDKGINLNKDQQLLTQLDAETSFLVKPKSQELHEQLWCERGWDILCFSGHSSSEMDASTGYIYINDTDKLSIPDLKNSLSTAIERGLQIAIFNSCDGLGLANQLAQLHIPQIIVFREPVPDRVAQEFLKNFLTAFASGKSFYLAVREARERLQSLENHFPCASWLPVICQNPAEVPPTWRSLQNP
ncbi:pentapeptide repeat-containing protein [Microcoleus anatoxicus]|uniref:Pentapeptide repeat-containing protein n=1 Tax=Microcoleus anatoxicus PTRS2 TaxID=2705321 RepID=A0ABU8YM67_9CYAN